MLAPSRTQEKVVIRMPDGMRAAIQAEAAKALRSTNAHIVWMLQRQMDEGKTTAGESLQAEPAVVPE